MPPRTQPKNPISKALAAVRRDPQKAGILTVLFAILGVLQVRLHMNRSGGPASANASAPASVAPSNNSHGHSLSGPSKPMDAQAALRAWMEQPSVSLKRNLFAVDLERFPQDSGHATSANTEEVGFWDDVAKSLTIRADQRRGRQILMENLSQQASQLRLQSTMMGATPKAVIDGDLVGEGDVVAVKSGEGRIQFRVLKIEARRIIVEREGIRLVIQMK